MKCQVRIAAACHTGLLPFSERSLNRFYSEGSIMSSTGVADIYRGRHRRTAGAGGGGRGGGPCSCGTGVILHNISANLCILYVLI